MSKEVYLRMQLAEARGEIPKDSAGALTYAAILESGVRSVLDGYYGPKSVQEAFTDAKNISNGKEEQLLMDIADDMLEDVRPLTQVMQDTHTTGDFPLALAGLRRRMLRDPIQTVESNWRSFASVITVPDFKNIRSMSLTELGELRLRPEATDVQYTTWNESEAGYRIANYERAIAYTWEMWLNDEIGMFNRALRSLGRGARRTEAMVVYAAIDAGLTRITPPTQGAGGPTIDRLKEVRWEISRRMFQDEDGNDLPYGYDLTDIIYGTIWRDDVFLTLNTQFIDYQGGTPNILRGAFNATQERLWERVMGMDWIAFDNSVDWLEVAFLQGFQGGPLTYTKMPNVREQPNQGSFENHTLAVKLGHTLGAKVIEDRAVYRVAGE